MKALFVAHNVKISGANKSFLGIIEQLRERMDIVVLVNIQDGELVNALKQMNVDYLVGNYDWWDAHSRTNIIKQYVRWGVDAIHYYSKRLSKTFIYELKSENFNFVYTNTSTVDVGAKIAQILDIPHFWHIREFGKEDFSFKRITTMRHRKKCLQQAKKIIVISEQLKHKYAQIVSEDKLKVIYNGFDVTYLQSKMCKKDFSRVINVLVTGQVSPAKGQDQAVKAVANLREKGYPIHLYLAGAIDHNFINPILKKYKNSGEYVTLLGTVKNMYKFRNEIDIELVCSKSEAFGRVTLEAMLHSIPVVGTNTGGTPELIQDKITGLLYNYGDIFQLEKQIEYLILDPKMYYNIVKNAYEFASQFTIERTANQVWNVFTNKVE